MPVKQRILAVGAALVCAFAAPAVADPITFDPTGGGGGISNVGSFDWAPGNALAVGAVPLSLNATFNLLYQANLGLLKDTSGVTVFAPGVGNTNYVTLVAGFTEQVTSLTTVTPTQQSATFEFVPGQLNFFKIYANNVLGNDLTGANFTSDNLILSGTITSTDFTSSFNTQGTPQAFDQFGGNDYGALTTVIGSGATQINATVTSFNAGYFPDLDLGQTIAFFNTSQKLAFQEGNPSRCFTDLTGTTSCATQANIGDVNGLNPGNFQFQADGNSSFRVPEPGTLALLGLALVGFAARRGARQG